MIVECFILKPFGNQVCMMNSLADLLTFQCFQPFSGSEVVMRPRVSLWQKVQQEQLDMFARQPPTNAFEEMIQWTKEGKLWQFPINNEQGLWGTGRRNGERESIMCVCSVVHV